MTTKQRILAFIPNATAIGFTARQIGVELNLTTGFIRKHLKELKAEGLVRVSDRYWTRNTEKD